MHNMCREGPHADHSNFHMADYFANRVEGPKCSQLIVDTAALLSGGMSGPFCSVDGLALAACELVTQVLNTTQVLHIRQVLLMQATQVLHVQAWRDSSPEAACQEYRVMVNGVAPVVHTRIATFSGELSAVYLSICQHT